MKEVLNIYYGAICITVVECSHDMCVSLLFIRMVHSEAKIGLRILCYKYFDAKK